MTEEEIEQIRSANERAERDRTAPKGKTLSMSDHLDLIQGSLRLCAVAALFAAQPEAIQVFREYVKKNNLYPEQEWITPHVLGHASVVTLDHSNAGDQVRNLEGLINAFVGRAGGPGPLSKVQ